MNQSYSIRREPVGLALPLGAAGVAGAGAVALAIVGLTVPIAWLETISFQLYLDTITPAAAPPLGTTARIVAAVALAAFGALLGYVLARAFDVVPSDRGFSDLIAHFRGPRDEDEADAPDLRAVDRHPDAPARRPFSAARDIEAVEEDGHWRALSPRDAADDAYEDELLLDTAFADASGSANAAPEPVLEPAVEVANDPVPATGTADEAQPIDAYDLSPPSLDDWEREAEAVVGDPAGTDASPAQVATPQPAPRRAAPAPLDLSVARLDELIARLESGLTRRAAAPTTAASMAGEGDAPAAGAQADDPAFPHDPALAAALATLRKMNLRAV